MSLSYKKHVVIEENIAGLNRVGGLSGITYNHQSNCFLACADKPPSRLLKIKFNDDQLDISVTEELLLKPNLLSKSELEGIVFDAQRQVYFLSDEQAEGTRIVSINTSGQFKAILLPKNMPFLPLSGYNSGIEGLTLSADGNTLYFAFERPTSSCTKHSLTTIGKINLQTSELQTFPYPLHEVKDDNLKTNGISEILWLSEDRLLVMERAYLPGTGNVVRLYDTELATPLDNDQNPINCADEDITPALTKPLFDFASVNTFNIDNAEGMTFNEDRSELIIVTDNNFSGKQETQLIVLYANWKTEE